MAPFRKLRTKLGLRKATTATKPLRFGFELPQCAIIGSYTYGITSNTIFACNAKAPLNIGSFCSIAPGAVLLCRGNHPMNMVSTFPFYTAFTFTHPQEESGDLIDIGGITIGNDVWIGRNAIIMPSVQIGDGAVIGAGSIVTKNVPPYAVVAGNPAKLIRYRFSQDTIDKLRNISWWDWSDDKIKRHMDDFFLPIDEFTARHYHS